MNLDLFYTAFPDRKIAEKMIEELLKRHLITCAHIIGEGTSFYVWKGAFEKSAEVYCLLKTIAANKDQIFSYFCEEHPYEAFPLIRISAESFHEPYNQWMIHSLKKS